ncbi:histidine kinase [Modestobacter sp. NPDC049651]|uniref:sensor histidine kinase n=1 Tax=unclassified Modestobacter TaxID=2643866 RepID=UPI0033EC98DE
MTPPSLSDRLRADGAAVAAVLGHAALAAVRREGPAAPPWAGRRWLVRVLTLLTGAFALEVAAASASTVYDGNGVAYFFCLLPAVVALVLAPRRPLDAWLVVTGVVVLLEVAGTPMQWIWLLWIPALLLAAAVAQGRTLLGIVVVTGAGYGICLGVQPDAVQGGWHLGAAIVLAMAVVLGAALGGRQRARAALRGEQERASDALARQGALAERARIAREMHDVVAHHMSLIAVRCETAPYRLAELPPAVRGEFAEVASAARQSLAEMQGLLGVLRSDDGAERAPQPGLADVEQLLRSARAAGAELQWELIVPVVPEAVGLSAYRIVQQAVANAGQHAPGAWVRVRVESVDGVLRIEVVNGPGTTTAAAPGSGTGLTGMRERAAVHGGELTAGPTPDGGFQLTAELPIGVLA